jgi:hypothetical protein
MQALDHSVPSPIIGSVRVGDRAEDLPLSLEITRTGCRAQVQSPRGTTLVTLASGKVTALGPPMPALEAFVALACPLLSFKNVPASDAETEVTKIALGWGVDMNIASLSRVEGRFGYVVGAAPRALKQPQIWFDQASNRPLRVIAPNAGQVWDVRFIDAGSIATNRLAPRVVTVWAGSARQLELHLMAATPRLSGEEGPATDVEEDSD